MRSDWGNDEFDAVFRHDVDHVDDESNVSDLRQVDQSRVPGMALPPLRCGRWILGRKKPAAGPGAYSDQLADPFVQRPLITQQPFRESIA